MVPRGRDWMRLSALRLPLFVCSPDERSEIRERSSNLNGGPDFADAHPGYGRANLGRERAARTEFVVVVAGLDPATHAEKGLIRSPHELLP